MDNKYLRGNYHYDKNSYLVGGEPAIFHCHHYNCSLQAFILDTTEYLSGVEDILKDCAQEISFTQFSNALSDIANHDDKVKMVEDYFRFAGFGHINIGSITSDGGRVEAKSDHYGIGWKSKYGTSKNPVSFFTAGFLSGALDVIYNQPLGTFKANQVKCIAMGDDLSAFELSKSDSKRNLILSQGAGGNKSHQLQQPSADQTGVNYSAVREALTNMPIEGHPETGIIDVFGVLLTRHYSNYYCNISYTFLNHFEKEMGTKGLSVATKLLIEAGHVCAFNTFGGIMQSNEWNGMIKPMLTSDDDWIHGIVAVVNSFGWGFWEVDEFIPNEKLRLKIYNGYESNSYIGRFEKSNTPISFLATGGVAGLMNLIYVLDLPNKAPVTLDEQLYKKIHESDGFFTAKQLSCRAMGDDYDLIEATKAK